MTDQETAAGIGHNRPPENIAEKLLQDHKQIFDRITDLSASVNRVPDTIEDVETHKKALDLFKMVRVAIKQAEEARKIEKEPWTNAAKEVDGTFSKYVAPLKKGLETLKDKTERFAERLKERERIAREEKARIEREKAEAAERAAREAEARRVEAERQKREAEQAAERARQERAKAEAEAEAAKERAKEAARKAAWEDEKREEARKDREAEEQRQREAKEFSQRKLEEARAAEEKAAAANRRAREERKAENENLADALNAEKRSHKLDHSAKAGSAELSRSRSDRGTVGSLSDKWVARIDNIHEIPIEEIRPYISHDAIRVAVNMYVKAGGRHLKGVTITRDQDIRVI